MKHSKYLSKFLDKEVAVYHDKYSKSCNGILRGLTKEYIIIETNNEIWKSGNNEGHTCLRWIPKHQINFIDSGELENDKS